MFTFNDQSQDMCSVWRSTCESSRNAYLTDSSNIYLITLPAQGPYEEQYQAATENVQQDWLHKTRAPEINPCETEQLITAQAHSTLLNPNSQVPRGYRHGKRFSVARAPWLNRMLWASSTAQAPLLLLFLALQSDLHFPDFTRITGDPRKVSRLQHLHPQH